MQTGADRSKEKYCNLCTGRRRRIAACQCTPYRPNPQSTYFDAMAEIRKCRLAAPVKAGTVVIKGILGLDDVIVTISWLRHNSGHVTLPAFNE